MYFLEAGFLLLVAPWSVFWERNEFARWWPALGALATNHYVRGAVSGIGLICLVAALAELAAFFAARRAPPAAASLGTRLDGADVDVQRP